MNEQKILVTLVEVERYLSLANKDKPPKGVNIIGGLRSENTLSDYLEATSDSTSSEDRMANSCLAFYKKHCMNLAISSKTLHLVFMSLIKVDALEAFDILQRWEDAIPYVKGETLNNLLSLLKRLCDDPSFPPKSKYNIAKNLFDRGFVEICYDVFLYLLSCRLGILEHAECCKYLYISENKNYKDALLAELKKIMQGHLSSEHKLTILASFTGSSVRFISRGDPIKCVMDVELVCELYELFFFDEKNDKKDIILSSNFLFKKADEKIVSKVEEKLLAMGKDETLSQNIRADSLDTLSRMSENTQKAAEAFLLLRDMGYDSSMKKFKTIYDSSQNVHGVSIQDSINKAIIKLIKEETSFGIDYKGTLKEIEPYVEKQTGERKYNIRKSLNRVIIDDSTFTYMKVCLSEILCAVWNKIKTFPTFDEYIVRLLDELEEMAETCSSGFASRLINTLSGEYDVVQISWEEQIRSNIGGRMTKKMKDLPEGDEKDAILLGMMQGASESDAQQYERFLRSHEQDMYQELYREFVTGGYINDKDFKLFFDRNFSPNRSL